MIGRLGGARVTARAVAAALALAVPQAAAAQTPADSRPVGRLEVSGGVGWLGPAALGTRDANLRANRIAPEPYHVFAADMRVQPASAVAGRVGFALTRRYTIEGTVSFARPELRASVSDDVEGAPPLDLGERFDQYLVDGGLIVMLDELRLGPLVPIAGGGVGYVRELHEGMTLIESGRFFYGVVGIRHWLFARPRGLLKAMGARADVRLLALDGGITVDDRVRRHGTISGSLFVVF